MNADKNLGNKKFKIIHRTSHEKEELKTHHHNVFEIIWIKSGRSIFNISKKRYTAQPDSMVLINNFETHSTRIEIVPYERYYMLIPKEFLSGVIHDPVLLSILKNRPSSFCHVINFKDNYSKINSIVEKIYNEYIEKPDYSDEVIKNYLGIMLVTLYRSHREYFQNLTRKPQLSIVSSVQQYIETNFLENITLKGTADYFHIDMYYLSHIFKEITGFRFKEYLIKYRVNHAKDLLINTDKTVTEICSDSGFNNVNNFIRTFKNIEGDPPSAFRKSHSK